MAALSQTAANVLLVSGVKRIVIAGGTITAGMPVYKDLTDANKFKAARGNAVATAVVDGIALNGASNGQPLSIQTSGVINLGATLAVGESYFVSDAVAGQIIPAADLGVGDFPRFLGQALTAANLELDLFGGTVAKA